MYVYSKRQNLNISQGHCIFITRLHSHRPAICLSCCIYSTYSHHHMVRLGIKGSKTQNRTWRDGKKGERENDRKENTKLGEQEG